MLTAFDGAVALLLLWLAWRTLTSRDLFQAIVLFIAFSLLMALSWVRLDAPDVALAEAAIGAGLTGVLLLAALVGLRRHESSENSASPDEGASAVIRRSLTLVLALAVAGGLGYAIFALPTEAEGLSRNVLASMQASGVTNSVTAVLLNFRGYDTLLEMIVLLMAVLGVWSLGLETYRPADQRGEVLESLSRFLAPVMIMVAIYLLWVGGHAPGGAFQAGSVLGAAAVLLLLAGWHLRAGQESLALRFTLAAGPGVFLVLAALTLLIQGRLLEYPSARAGTLILVVEAIAAISIGATLAALYRGVRPDNGKELG